jgi:hypothetical protein
MVLFDKSIYVYTFYTHELKKVYKGDDVIYGQLAPDGKTILYSTLQGLYKMDLEGNNLTRIGATSLIFSCKDDYLIDYRNNEFTKINWATGEKTEIGYNGERLEKPDQFLISSNGEILYLRIKNKLFSLKVQQRIFN